MSTAASPLAAETWTVRRVTGTPPGRWLGGTAHSYYDIPVFDGAGARIVAHRLPFEGRHPSPDDAVEVGLASAEPGRENEWHRLGESRAWSWQQGPMAQWVGGGPGVLWNDREEGRVVARLHDTDTGETTTLPGQVYAVDPAGRTALSLDMTRLDRLRPGYGYPAGTGTQERMARRPAGDGVWAMNLAGGERRLILTVADAVAFLDRHRGPRDRLSRTLGRMHYWFNHAKIAPDGARFTVKLRWRRIGGPWDDRQGVSLTCGMDGRDLRLLAPATSHVIWMNERELYFWQRDGLRLHEDTAPSGTPLRTLAPKLVRANVHIRHLDAAATRFVLDTPYREEIDVMLWDAAADETRRIGRFTDHVPARGPFRCDLHPNPSPDGRRIALTSLQNGRREIFVAERT